MAYLVPAASAVDFAVTRRPTRLHALPGLSGTMLMDGPLVPPEAPRLRRRALAAWVPAGERAAVGSVGMTGLAERDVRRGERLRLAAPMMAVTPSPAHHVGPAVGPAPPETHSYCQPFQTRGW